MPKKTVDQDAATFEPFFRTKTIQYLEADAAEGAAPFEITMASDLTMEELDNIQEIRRRYVTAVSESSKDGGNATDLEMEFLDALAPFVMRWPFRDRRGEDIPAPADGGGQMFKKVPASVLNAVVRDLVNVNMGRVDPKS